MSRKLELLIITHHNVFPVDSGAAMTTVSYIEEMQKWHKVSVVITNPFVPSQEDLEKLKSRWSNVRIFHGDGAGHSSGHQGFMGKVRKGLYKTGILKAPVYTLTETAQFNYSPLRPDEAAVIQRALDAGSYDIIEVNYVEKFPAIFMLPADTIKVAVNHEPRFRRTMVQNQGGLLEKKYGSYLEAYQYKIENDLMDLYDAVICLNQEDTELVGKSVSKPIYQAPVSASWEDISEIEPIHTPVEHVFFLGSGNHHPNFDAVDWYVQSMAKTVFEELSVKLEVIGDWPAEKQKQLESPYVIFKGFVDDLNIYAENSVMLVPVRTGGGIRTKIQWAMSKGIPVVSTAFGHEGIPCVHERSIMQAEDVHGFVDGIRKLKSDNSLRNLIRKEANEIIREHFSPKTVVDSRSLIYSELLNHKLVLQ
jgi:glycosyltransferase involved in cell wall biosynthesis